MAALRGPRAWAALAALLAVLLTAGTYALVLAPARDQAASVQAQVDDATLQQTVLRHRLRDLDAAAARQADLQASLAAARAALPATADTQGLLRRVQAVATGSGVVVEAVGVKAPTATSVTGVWAVPVDVSLLGRADALLAALGQLQTGAGRLVTVGSSTLEAGDGGSMRLTLAVQVYTTSAPTGDAAGTASAPGAAAAAPAGTGGAVASAPADAAGGGSTVAAG